jgi:hypothetical protein
MKTKIVPIRLNQGQIEKLNEIRKHLGIKTLGLTIRSCIELGYSKWVMTSEETYILDLIHPEKTEIYKKLKEKWGT